MYYQVHHHGSCWHPCLLLGILLLHSSIPPALCFRSSQQSSQLSVGATASNLQLQRARMHTPFNSEASLQVAARQRLFDYAVGQGLDILDLAVKKIQIPEYKTTIEIPVIGGIDVDVANVNITNLGVPRDLAKVAIESGYYHLKAANLTAQITFNWAWSKGPLSGSGYGELSLKGGSLDEIFLVRNQEAGVPQLVAVSSAVGFESLDLNIHSYSADWLYQALLYIFSGTIKRQIEEALNSAVHTDVPAAINGLLDSLPAKVSVQGLPFDVVFTYAVYTLNYVIVKGYGEVAIDTRLAPRSLQPVQHYHHHHHNHHHQQQQQQHAQSQPGPAGATVSAGNMATAAAAVNAERELLQFLEGACPFPAAPLPFSPADIGSDSKMFSIYIHEAIPNCILWGLFHAGALQTTVQDGNIPQLRLITDLFGGLIPELPKHYPKKGMLLDIQQAKAPQVRFMAGQNGGVVLSASYNTNVSVLDAAGDGQNLLVAQLTANVSLAADFGWTQTVIHSANVSYAALQEVYPVNVAGWNQIIDWVVKQAGPKQSLGQLWDTYVKTPATPYLTLDNVQTHGTDEWFVVSSDVKVKQLPPIT